MSAKQKEKDQSYWGIVKRQFRKNKLAVWSLRVVYVVFFVGLLADFLANEKPFYCKLDGKTYFPIFQDYAVSLHLEKMPPELLNVDWVNADYQSVLRAPIPYSPLTQDWDNAYANPFKKQGVRSWRFRHFLGSDQLGRDLLSGLIHGTRIAMLVGIVSMSIASFIGILLGAFAGYFGDNRLQVSRVTVWLNFLFLFFGWFYAFNVRSYAMSDALADSFGSFTLQFLVSLFIFFVIMAIPNLIAMPLKKIPGLGKPITIPVDILISRTIEVLNSVPILLLILSICAVVKKPSIMLIMVIIGFTGWTGIASYIRAELLKVRSLEYIEAAQSLGFSEWRVMLRHAIPNSLTSVLITIAFGIASAILTESSLSFLGIGVQADVVTWGKLLNEARADVSGWWFAVFPGLAIFITVTVFNLLGEGLTEAMDPRLKQ
ncbi:MAG TPA: ABC transporter permease [Chitinophagales bacterium]|nr:ABC transporter permease [Chitinophagales bacterium]